MIGKIVLVVVHLIYVLSALSAKDKALKDFEHEGGERNNSVYSVPNRTNLASAVYNLAAVLCEISFVWFVLKVLSEIIEAQ